LTASPSLPIFLLFLPEIPIASEDPQNYLNDQNATNNTP